MAREIKRQRPDATLHVRIERRDDPRNVFEPDEQRAAIVAYQPDDAAPTFGEKVASWRVGNESNVESPALAPAQWAIGQNEMLSRARAVCPKGTRRYVPARSSSAPDPKHPERLPFQRFDEWRYAAVVATTTGGFDSLNCHAYGPPDPASIGRGG